MKIFWEVPNLMRYRNILPDGEGSIYSPLIVIEDSIYGTKSDFSFELRFKNHGQSQKK